MSGWPSHVLDLAAGKPANHVRIELFQLRGQVEKAWIGSFQTNEDGRVDEPLLPGEGLQQGTYEMVFRIGEYYKRQGVNLPEPPFLDEVVIRFGISDPSSHYHVPLLVSPWGYQVYRGS